MDPENRRAPRFRTPRPCTVRRIRVPETYEALERMIVEWMGRCVVTDSIEDQRGVPLNRHEALVQGNASLQRIWERIQYIPGRAVTIRARYVRQGEGHGHRVTQIIFSIPRFQAADPADSDFSLRRMQNPIRMERPAIEGELSDALANEDGSVMLPDSLSVVGGLTSGLKELIQGFLRTAIISAELPRFRGRAYGFCDALALAATSPGFTVQRRNRHAFRASSLISPNARISDGIVEVAAGNSSFLQGYREGRMEAKRFLQQHEQLRGTDPNMPTYNSVIVLEVISSTYGNNRRQIRQGLLEEIPDYDTDIRALQRRHDGEGPDTPGR